MCSALRRARCVVVVKTGVLETQPGQEARQAERQGQGVLALGDPGHGLDRHRVQRKEHARQPCAGDFQPPQHPPEQHRARRVQQHVQDVVAGRIQSPQAPLEPEQAGRQRHVVHLLSGEPETAEAVGGADERVVGQEDAVVPHEPGAEDGRVGEQRRGEDHRRRQESARGARALRGLAHPRHQSFFGHRHSASYCAGAVACMTALRNSGATLPCNLSHASMSARALAYSFISK